MLLGYLHVMSKRLAILKYLLQRLGTQDVAQCGGGEQTSRVLSVLNIYNRGDRIEYAKVDDGVHSHSDRILGEYFLGWHVERDGSQVDRDQIVYAGQNEEQTRSFGTARHYATEPKYDL
jgi:hypothetical protein